LERKRGRQQDIRVQNDEVVINNVIVPKRMMFNQQKILQNGVKLTFEHTFGFYQRPIRKNAYFISDGKYALKKLY
jgi:hypothetical protein